MKGIVWLSVSIFLAAFVLTVMPVYGEAKIYDDVLRLHVIAESDSEEDQTLKLKVRDAVLICVSERLDGVNDYDEAYEIIDGMCEEIKSAAFECVKANGFDCIVNVELGREKYPRREYDGVSLPAGVYNSLRVTLGEGAGKNWWCILFPSICTSFAKAEAEPEYVALKRQWKNTGRK